MAHQKQHFASDPPHAGGGVVRTPDGSLRFVAAKAQTDEEVELLLGIGVWVWAVLDRLAANRYFPGR